MADIKNGGIPSNIFVCDITGLANTEVSIIYNLCEMEQNGRKITTTLFTYSCCVDD